MTGYTGWDNYLKEQEKLDKVLSGAPEDPRFRQFRPGIDDPDKWLFAWLNDRLERLENWQDKHIGNTIEDSLHSRVKDLEAKIDGIVSGTISQDMNLRDRVKDLEEWKSKAHEDMRDIFTQLKDIKGDVDNYLIARLERLEEWKKLTGGSILARIKFLEEWKQGVIRARQEWLNRLEKLEEYRDSSNEDLNDLEDKVKDLEGQIKNVARDHRCDANNDLYNRVIALEDWKQGHLCDCQEWKDKDYDNFKMIDKKVWEDIKHYTKRIGLYFPPDHHNRDEYNMLSDAIKKAEGGET